jgi:hypothetical protein
MRRRHVGAHRLADKPRNHSSKAWAPLGRHTPVHPNDHANVAWSSNDSSPSGDGHCRSGQREAVAVCEAQGRIDRDLSTLRVFTSLNWPYSDRTVLLAAQTVGLLEDHYNGINPKRCSDGRYCLVCHIHSRSDMSATADERKERSRRATDTRVVAGPTNQQV